MKQLQQRPRILILSGDGLNCQNETAFICQQNGLKGEILHINELLARKDILHNYQGLIIPGGFSFGDELGTGKVLALKMKYELKEELLQFVNNKKPILGICNGLQVLLKLGLLPFPDAPEKNIFQLAPNISGNFIDRWVHLTIPAMSNCLWTQTLKGKTIEMPIRHGEGRIVVNLDDPKSHSILSELKELGQISFQYHENENFNGSVENMAGLSDPSGHILGLMPHPEAFPQRNFSPFHQKEGPTGAGLFQNILSYLKNS